MLKWNKKLKGFTLVELLIVVAITVILAVVAAPNFLSYKAKQDLNDESRSIVSVLRNAQDRAISESSNYGVFFSNIGSTASYTQFQGANYQIGTTTSKTVLRSDLMFISPVAGASSSVVFFRRTGLPSASTTIIISLLSNSQTSSTVIINSNGTIQY